MKLSTALTQCTVVLERALKDPLLEAAFAAASAVTSTALRSGHKILICGNGGSASCASHFAAELLGLSGLGGTKLPAIALSADTATLSAIGNDHGYEEIFSHQILHLGAPGDILIALSTSGQSRNILAAVETANTGGLTTVSLTGSKVGALSNRSSITLAAPSTDTARVQELHMLYLHTLATTLVESLTTGN